MTTLANKIADAIRTGTAPLITITELLEAPRVLDGAVIAVDVSFVDDPLGLESLYHLAALTPGVPIGQWLPNEGAIAPIFGSAIAALEHVTFVLDVNAKSLLSISSTVLLAKDRGGVTVTALESPRASATIERLQFTVASPLSPPRAVDVQIFGALSLGALTLDVIVAAPELSFSAQQRDGQALALSDLIDSFGLPLASRFAGLTLDGLRLDLFSRQHSGYVEVLIGTDDGPFSLLDGVLGLNGMTLVVEHAPGSTQATIAANLVVREKLTMGVLVAADSGAGTWQIGGSLDVPATVAALGKPEGSPVTVADLITTIFGFSLPAQMSGFLGGIGIEQLEGSVTIGQASTAYTLDTVVVVNWELAEGVNFDARTAISVDDGEITVTGDFDIGGFALSLAYAATDPAGSVLTATVPQLAGLQANYSFEQGTLEFSFANAPSTTLGSLLADFIGFVTGNSHVQLPAPWDVLGDVDLRLDAVTLSVNLKTRAVSIAYRDDGMISLFGFSIDGFELDYDSKAARGQRLKFTILGNLKALTGEDNPSFNPEKPSTAPAVPGAGAALFDIRLVAVGQHVVLPPADATSVETAVAAIAKQARSAGDDPANLPVFSKDAGWLIGAHLIFQGAVDFQMVFADPSIYGVLVEVKSSSTTSPALQALVGLRAEILYRRISETIGVYEGSLTLPDRIRKIDYGAFQLQLPSLAVAIYTNGDFLIDVGFPHGGDFSKSLIITAGQYTGAGGVYYGRLSGETATNLPAVPRSGGKDLGAFGSVTAIGIGLRVGIQRGFSKGPLSASFSVVLQAIFEGVFSTYTQFSPYATEDYYDIRASISIIGQLEGTLDFAIVTASLLVRIEVTIAVRAIAKRQVQVPVTARVTVRVSVKINLGLFSIRIHFSFDATVGFTATFGSNERALWDGSGPMALGFADSIGPASLTFVAPPVGLQAPLYVVPQLSRGVRNGSPAWIYTLQLALAAPQAKPGNESLAGDGTMFVDFAKLVTAWVANAAYPGDAAAKTLDDYYGSISLDPDQLAHLLDLLQAARANGSAAPSVGDIQALLAANQFTVQFPESGSGDVGLGFFPMPPGCTVSYAQGQDAPSTISGDVTRQGQLLRDYVLMIALKILDDASQLEPPQTLTLAQIFAALGPAKLSGATALTTRFMLHGTRIDMGAGQLQALYELTGQQAVLSKLDATSLALSFGCAAPASWGLVFPPSATAITLTSAAGQLYAPPTIATFPSTISETGVVSGDMPSVVTMMQGFSLLLGLPGASATLRRLPRQLIALAQAGGSDKFRLYEPSQAPYAGTYEWSTTVPFDVRRIPDPSGSAPYLANTYALVGLQSDGVDALLNLYRGQTEPGGGPAITRVELAWIRESASKGRSLSLIAVEPATVFLFQKNIATGSTPDANEPAEPPISPQLDFLGRLLGGGLGSVEGLYLNLNIDGGLPAEVFDARGLARLMVVVSFNTNVAGDQLRPYYTAARLANLADAERDLSAGSPTVTTERATVPPGLIGAQVTRPDPDDDAPGYQSSLDNLYNLIAFEPKQITGGGQQIAVALDVPPAIGPLDPGDAPAGTLIYRHVFDLLQLARASSSDPLADSRNPYRFVGGLLTVGYHWIDLFGDELPAGIGGSSLAITYTDPLANLGDWPGLVFGFKVEGGGGKPRRLLLKSTWVPENEGAGETLSDAARAQYVAIYHQLAGSTITASISISDAKLSPFGGSPGDTLRANIRKILDEVDDASEPVALADVAFALPDDDSAYHDDLLQQLTATIEFARADLADPDFSAAGREAILRSRSLLAPYHPVVQADAEDQAELISYRAFAESFEQAFASMQLKVLAGALDAVGGGQFYVLRWGASGLNLGFSPATGDGERGYAPPPFATSLQSRVGIQPLVNQTITSDEFKLPDAPLSITNLDLDAAMAAFLIAVERFLSPDLGVPAARLEPAFVDRCVAAKQTLAGLLSARALALASDEQANADALAAAREAYRQACLLALTSYYSVDAIGVLEVSTTVPSGVELPALAVHGQPVQDQRSDVSVATGRAALRSGSSAPLALSLSSRNKGWQASYEVPQTFAIEAFELVTGSIAIATTNEPVVGGLRQERQYRTGDWLRFVLDANTRQPVEAPPISLPLRVYPPAPVLVAQGFSPAPIDADVADVANDASGPIREAKSWSLDAEYRHTYTAQDKLHLTVVLNERPAARFGMADDEQDLLDALVQFQTLYPRIQTVFEAQPRSDADFRAAIAAFVSLVEYVRDHFEFVPEAVAVDSVPIGVGETWKFTIQERFEDDPQTAPFEAELALALAPELNFTLPPPTLTISGYHSYIHDQAEGRWTYRFRNSDGEDLPAIAGIGTPERSLSIEPLDVIDWQNGRVYLQVIRNEGLPKAFVYETPVVGARDYVVPFVQRTVDIDIATLPRPSYGQAAPPEGSLLDWTARLFHVLLGGQADEEFANQGGVRTSVSMTWPLTAGAGSLELPRVRLPIVLTLPQSIAFDPTPDQAVELVRPLVKAVNEWLAAEAATAVGSELRGHAELDFEVTVFSEMSGTGMPILYLDGLTLALTAIAEAP